MDQSKVLFLQGILIQFKKLYGIAIVAVSKNWPMALIVFHSM